MGLPRHLPAGSQSGQPVPQKREEHDGSPKRVLYCHAAGEPHARPGHYPTLSRNQIERLEFMHSRGILHRDIQLGNCTIGLPPNDKLIYMCVTSPFRVRPLMWMSQDRLWILQAIHRPVHPSPHPWA